MRLKFTMGVRKTGKLIAIVMIESEVIYSSEKYFPLVKCMALLNKYRRAFIVEPGNEGSKQRERERERRKNLHFNYRTRRDRFHLFRRSFKSRNGRLSPVNFADGVERRGSILPIARVERVVDVRIKSRGHLVNQKLSQLCLRGWR